VRPDGYGVVRLGRYDHGFFLEFDRGTVRSRALRAKFAGYQRFFSTMVGQREYDGSPVVLVVTTGPAADARIADAAELGAVGHMRGLSVFVTTVEWIASNPLGPLGQVWRRLPGSTRQSWWS
jgi:hypothetical protein